MTENQIKRNYQVSADSGTGKNQATASGAQTLEGDSTAAAQIKGTQPAGIGAQQDFTLAEAGSPEQVTDNSKLPKRIQEGISTRYPITDRNLDFEGEEGYPTPS